MKENLKNLNTPSPDINERNLLLKIWRSPTDTFRYIFINCPEKYVTILLVLGGVVNAIDKASSTTKGDNLTTLSILGIAILFGALFGWITFYVYAWALSLTGQWLDGKAAPTHFRTVIGWSLIPLICTLALVIPQVLIFGDDLYKSIPVNDSSFNNSIRIGFQIIEAILSIWSLVILIKGISLIQGFKIGKSILNMILPILFFAVPILLILFLFNLFD